MNKLYYSPEALNDLDEIWEYIASDLSNPDAARNTIDQILDKTERLREFSQTGAPLSSIANIISDYRFLVCGNYLVFYRDKGTEVFIDRVLYNRRDYLRVLMNNQGNLGER